MNKREKVERIDWWKRKTVTIAGEEGRGGMREGDEKHWREEKKILRNYLNR